MLPVGVAVLPSPPTPLPTGKGGQWTPALGLDHVGASPHGRGGTVQRPCRGSRASGPRLAGVYGTCPAGAGSMYPNSRAAVSIHPAVPMAASTISPVPYRAGGSGPPFIYTQ